jgi:CRISPR system Cascade subunit CasD
MTEYLHFNLYGPMAAWGEIAVGEQRPSDGYPGKSAILGLVAAALGLRRSDEIRHLELHQSLGFAVRVDLRGSLLRDYHTTQAPTQRKGKTYRTRQDEIQAGNLNTILSQRDYRCDAFSSVLLWLKDETSPWSLAELQQSLKKPQFVLYLGRKSCPLALPLSPQLIQANNLRDAFEQRSNTPELEGLMNNDSIAVYWEGDDFERSGFSEDNLHWQTMRRDALTSRKRWQYTERVEHYVSLHPQRGSE